VRLPLPTVTRESSGWALSFPDSAAPGIRSRFLVEATGRSSSLPGARTLLRPRTLALTARVAGTCLDLGDTRIEALPDGWLWAGRGSEIDAAVTLFIAPCTVRRWPRGEHAACFVRTLQSSALTAARSVLRVVSHLTVRDATAAERAPLTAEGLLRAGDVALALDPLSGQGFKHALVAGAQAATVLHTLLAREELAALARQFYVESHHEAAREHAATCQAFYQRQDRFGGPFWRERAGVTASRSSPSLSGAFDASIHEKLILSPEARWVQAPAITGEFVESQRALCHPSLTRPIRVS
jgi:hypothetical protein